MNIINCSPNIIPDLLELASRRLVVRVLIVPASKRTAISLMTAINQEDNFTLITVKYNFNEKSRGNVTEECEIKHTIGTGLEDPEIILAMEDVVLNWNEISSSWCSGNERVLETFINNSVKIGIKLQHECFSDLVQEFLSRIHTRAHYEKTRTSSDRLSMLLGIFNQRLGALLSENRPW